MCNSSSPSSGKPLGATAASQLPSTPCCCCACRIHTQEEYHASVQPILGAGQRLFSTLFWLQMPRPDPILQHPSVPTAQHTPRKDKRQDADWASHVSELYQQVSQGMGMHPVQCAACGLCHGCMSCTDMPCLLPAVRVPIPSANRLCPCLFQAMLRLQSCTHKQLMRSRDTPSRR
jgi:hypothetical protein